MRDLIMDGNDTLRQHYMNAEAEIQAKWANVSLE